MFVPAFLLTFEFRLGLGLEAVLRVGGDGGFSWGEEEEEEVEGR